MHIYLVSGVQSKTDLIKKTFFLPLHVPIRAYVPANQPGKPKIPKSNILQ